MNILANNKADRRTYPVILLTFLVLVPIVHLAGVAIAKNEIQNIPNWSAINLLIILLVGGILACWLGFIMWWRKLELRIAEESLLIPKRKRMWRGMKCLCLVPILILVSTSCTIKIQHEGANVPEYKLNSSERSNIFWQMAFRKYGGFIIVKNGKVSPLPWIDCG